MSLDVYLTKKDAKITHSKSRIYIRENGQTKQIPRQEWDERFPGREPISAKESTDDTVYHANITHNLGKMANEALLYYYLWEPEKMHISKANDLIASLQLGLDFLVAAPKRFKQFNPENGWGSYEVLVEFVRNYLEACKQYPDADVSVWR